MLIQLLVFQMPGQIDLIIGPMFSGKTLGVIQRATIAQVARKSVLVVKHSLDVRWDNPDAIVTHSGTKLQASIRASTLAQVVDQISASPVAYDMICVDEGQFFPDLADMADVLANSGRHVVIAALDGNFLNHPTSRNFDQVIKLIPR